MPQRGGWTTIQIREDVKERFKKIYQKDRKRPGNQTFNGYMDELFKKIVTYNEQLDKYGQFIEFSSINGNEIELIDRRKSEKKIVTIHIDKENKIVRCLSDNIENCIHIGFCFSTPELYLILLEKGIKPSN